MSPRLRMALVLVLAWLSGFDACLALWNAYAGQRGWLLSHAAFAVLLALAATWTSAAQAPEQEAALARNGAEHRNWGLAGPPGPQRTLFAGLCCLVGALLIARLLVSIVAAVVAPPREHSLSCVNGQPRDQCEYLWGKAP